MPRPVKPRTLDINEVVAARVTTERVNRGLSYDALARLMAEAGCPISGPSIQKIEKSGRRIDVDEALAFAMVFGIKIDELLTPPDVRLDFILRNAIREGPAAWLQFENARSKYLEHVRAAAEAIRSEPSSSQRRAFFKEVIREARKRRSDDPQDSIAVQFLSAVAEALEEADGATNQ